MIIFIPFLRNDYVLVLAYALIIIFSFAVNYEKKDILFFLFGFVAMTVSEYFFIKTGVETFERKSLFGVMPLWLPILWAYVFVVMRRAISIIDKK